MDESLKGLLNTFGPELAQLDKSFTDKSSKDKPFRLDPRKIMSEGDDGPIPSSEEIINQQPQPDAQPQPQPQPQPQTQTQPQPQTQSDNSQMEMSFGVTDINKIYDLLDGIYLRLTKIEKKLNS